MGKEITKEQFVRGLEAIALTNELYPAIMETTSSFEEKLKSVGEDIPAEVHDKLVIQTAITFMLHSFSEDEDEDDDKDEDKDDENEALVEFIKAMVNLSKDEDEDDESCEKCNGKCKDSGTSIEALKNLLKDL